MLNNIILIDLLGNLAMIKGFLKRFEYLNALNLLAFW